MQLQLYGKKVWILKSPVDFRLAIDGLANIIANNIKKNPQEGIYLFYNRTKNKIKCLSWHKNGFVLIYKRLEQGSFQIKFNKHEGIANMSIEEVGWLFAGLEWQKMRQWRELPFDKFA